MTAIVVCAVGVSMTGSRGWTWGWGLLLLASGCIAMPLEDEEVGRADGALCEQDGDCRSGLCGRQSKLCGHSTCDCPGETCDEMGEASPDCAKGWVCSYYSSIIGDVGEVFGFDRDRDGGYCHPLCSAGCPEHYLCGDGHFCVPDTSWANPIATIRWSGGAEGTTSGGNGLASAEIERGAAVTLDASARSPIGAEIKSYAWTIVESHQQLQMEGQHIELSFPMDASFMRAELTVLDADSRGAFSQVSFDGCSGSGQTCGYQGSGCCKSCDSASNTCL